MPSVHLSGGWFNCGLVKSHLEISPVGCNRRAHAHTHAEEYIESKYICVCARACLFVCVCVCVCGRLILIFTVKEKLISK